jgi:hypothetical protein
MGRSGAAKVTVRTFEGRGHWAEWKFTMEPALAGSMNVECYGAEAPGFIRRQLHPARCKVQYLSSGQYKYAEQWQPLTAAAIRKDVLDPEPEWVEEAWLTQWLKDGHIKEVTDR